jgi:hypothetical protein
MSRFPFEKRLLDLSSARVKSVERLAPAHKPLFLFDPLPLDPPHKLTRENFSARYSAP